MEKRTIEISLVKARDWYYSNNSTLKALALEAFTKEEIEMPDFKSIVQILLNSGIYTLTNVQKNQLKELQNRDPHFISAPKLMRILALYFNKSWKKDIGNLGYFIAKRAWSGYQCHQILGEDWGIIKHETVNYPITYFSSEANCRKAFQIMKNLGKLDNLYSDF